MTTVTVHSGVFHRFHVKILGPRQDHEMTVFAADWNDASTIAVEKIQDKIRRHGFEGWGPPEGPWVVRSVTKDD